MAVARTVLEIKKIYHNSQGTTDRGYCNGNRMYRSKERHGGNKILKTIRTDGKDRIVRGTGDDRDPA